MFTVIINLINAELILIDRTNILLNLYTLYNLINLEIKYTYITGKQLINFSQKKKKHSIDISISAFNERILLVKFTKGTAYILPAKGFG